jgi:hypothetical protein
MAPPAGESNAEAASKIGTRARGVGNQPPHKPSTNLKFRVHTAVTAPVRNRDGSVFSPAQADCPLRHVRWQPPGHVQTAGQV